MPDEIDYLFLAAHPDDAELFCGGTIAKMIQLGYRVGILDLTRGEAATTGSVAEREAETARANEILGITWRRNLALPDSGLQDNDACRRPIVQVIRETRAKLLVAPLAPCRHPDHTATAQLAKSVHFFAGAGGYKVDGDPPIWRPHRVIHHLEVHEQRPTFVIDISDQFELKREAIRAYGSQFFSGKTYIGSGQFHDMMTARFAYYGGLIGVRYGEPYVMEGLLRLDDPLRNALEG